MPTEEALDHYQSILRAGQETPKIDFKLEFNPEGEGLSEVVKDFCALANSSDPAAPEQRQGLLFIGVDNNGTVRGLPPGFDHDALELRLTQRLGQRIAPPMRFSVSAPIQDEASGQTYAVIAIQPSQGLPYLAMQESGRVQPGQWFVRRNSMTVLAGPEEFADLQRRLLAQEAQPLRSGLDRLAGEIAVLREELASAQIRLATGQVTSPTELSTIPLAEAIRQQYAPKETHLVSRIRQLGRELTAEILRIDEEFLLARERTTAVALNAALDALEAAARPLVETVFEVSAYVQEATVWEAVAQALEETVNTTVVDRLRIDGAFAPFLWYPVTLCAYAAAVAAVIQHQYSQLVPMLSGSYDGGRFPLMRVVRVLPRAEEFYRHVTGDHHCAPLARRALMTMVGPAGWFTLRVQRKPEVTGYFAEIVLSLVWMVIGAERAGQVEGSPLHGSFLYQRMFISELHDWMKREREALQVTWPNLPELLALFDRTAGLYGSDGCFVEFQSHLAQALTDQP